LRFTKVEQGFAWDSESWVKSGGKSGVECARRPPGLVKLAYPLVSGSADEDANPGTLSLSTLQNRVPNDVPESAKLWSLYARVPHLKPRYYGENEVKGASTEPKVRGSNPFGRAGFSAGCRVGC
jgi:hypothetical protein